MTIARVTRDEVKRYFLLANKGKGFFKDRKLSRSELEDSYHGALEGFKKLEEPQLDDLFRDKIRLQRYNEMTWYKTTAAFSEMGSWPKMIGLDIRLTTGNITDTAEEVRIRRDKKLDLYIPKKFWEKLDSLEDNLAFVFPRFPLILFPGGEVREKDYNTEARKNGEPLCKIFRYDVDDGNNRAVAYSLSGMGAAHVFTGVRNE